MKPAAYHVSMMASRWNKQPRDDVTVFSITRLWRRRSAVEDANTSNNYSKTSIWDAFCSLSIDMICTVTWGAAVRDLIADWRRACSNVRGTKPISIVSHCTGLPPIGKTGKIRKGQGIRKWSKKSRVWVCVCVCVRVVCCVLPCVESWTQKLDSGKISDIPIIVGRRN